MALISLRQLLDHAAEHGYGLPAFNVNNMEQVQAIMQAADAVNSPVILQGSAGARSYAGEPFLRHLILAALEQYPDIPICMHQDHGASPDICLRSIQSGFSSVMMDGSLMSDGKTPSSYEYNVDVTGQVVQMAHAGGVSVEGELGCLGSLETGEMGEEDGHGAEGKLDMDMLLTDPNEAADFVKKTGVDALAIAIGTSHGAYKFKPEQCTRDARGVLVPPPLRFDILAEIEKKLPGFPIVLHGASSVIQEAVATINKYGGKMKDAVGVPEEQLRQAARSAVCKINIDTDGRMVMTATVRQVFTESPGEFDPRKYLGPARIALIEMYKRKNREVLGSAGRYGQEL
jgi:fructose-bisphosphate aldolase class II